MSGMNDYPFTFAGAGQQSLDIIGDFFHIIDAPNDIEIQFNRGRKLARAQGMGGSADYNHVTIHSLVAQTVIVALGFGTSFDSRATLNATITSDITPANTIDAGGDVNILTLQTKIIVPADLTRLAVLIQNIGTARIRVGGVGVAAASGKPLDPGEPLVLATTAAVWAHNPDAAAQDVSVLPLREV